MSSLIQNYNLNNFAAIFEGERGDSNPRIAAPQAAALTTWRRPPHIYKFNNQRVIFHSHFYFFKKFELIYHLIKFYMF